MHYVHVHVHVPSSWYLARGLVSLIVDKVSISLVLSPWYTHVEEERKQLIILL